MCCNVPTTCLHSNLSALVMSACQCQFHLISNPVVSVAFRWPPVGSSVPVTLQFVTPSLALQANSSPQHSSLSSTCYCMQEMGLVRSVQAPFVLSHCHCISNPAAVPAHVALCWSCDCTHRMDSLLLVFVVLSRLQHHLGSISNPGGYRLMFCYVLSAGDGAAGISWSQRYSYCQATTPSLSQQQSLGYYTTNCVLPLPHLFLVAAAQVCFRALLP